MIKSIGAELGTNRLRLVPFNMSHLDALSEIDGDPVVMRYIGDGSTKTRAQTADSINNAQMRWAKLGYSWWAVQLKTSGEVIGSACLQYIGNDETKPLEIGWRLRPVYFGHGYATEAGLAAIDFAFGHIGAKRLLAVAQPENTASTAVMQRLGMTYLGINPHYGRPCATYELLAP